MKNLEVRLVGSDSKVFYENEQVRSIRVRFGDVEFSLKERPGPDGGLVLMADHGVMLRLIASNAVIILNGDDYGEK